MYDCSWQLVIGPSVKIELDWHRKNDFKVKWFKIGLPELANPIKQRCSARCQARCPACRGGSPSRAAADQLRHLVALLCLPHGDRSPENIENPRLVKLSFWNDKLFTKPIRPNIIIIKQFIRRNRNEDWQSSNNLSGTIALLQFR